MTSFDRVWAGNTTTVGGVATFHITDDQTGTGTKYFNTIKAISLCPVANVSVATTVPAASVKALANPTLTVNVVSGTVLGVLGATTVFVPDGTVVYCTVWGID